MQVPTKRVILVTLGMLGMGYVLVYWLSGSHRWSPIRLPQAGGMLGVVHTSAASRRLTLSNDGCHFAYAWETETMVGVGPEGRSVGSDVYVCRGKTSSPDQRVCTSTEASIDFGPGLPTNALTLGELAFSPDGERIALVYRDRLLTIDA